MKNFKDILNEALDPTTAPNILAEYYKMSSTLLEKESFLKAIATNPNTDKNTLKEIFISEAGMANEIILNNPVTPLLVLENARIFEDWIVKCHKKIFAEELCDELIEVAIKTKNIHVYTKLAESKHTTARTFAALVANIKPFLDYNDIDYQMDQINNLSYGYYNVAIMKNQHVDVETLYELIRQTNKRRLIHQNYSKSIRKWLFHLFPIPYRINSQVN
ncbi:hypothetical protein NIES4071_92860 [Calothrix sp. NIES-4071]|nr:hypothetical protein NIES4071_92860 [Calothrix sp. NIES-4071]BAZ63553.1 hypothetical protein NIES4105_92790 [Calothrix sp. NIES-4105]